MVAGAEADDGSVPAGPAPFDLTGLPLLTSALLEAGLDEDEVRQVMGESLLRVLHEALPEERAEHVSEGSAPRA